ncbi:MAG: hypothetical protein JKY37_23535, partial [Nannocystaceae bacterium]|nr:hypothetical protein [Nannocystaceae bacterium]
RVAVRRANYADRPEERLPFACAFACADCLTLTWPEHRNEDPMRSTPEHGRPSHACPNCGEVNWVDLSIPKHAEALVTHLEHDRRPPARVGLRIIAGAVLAFSALLVYGGQVPRMQDVALSEVASAFVVLAVLAVLRRIVVRKRHKGFSFGHSGGRGRHVVSAPVVGDDSLRGPLTDTPCVAYTVEVTRDESRGTWLEEHRSDGAQVGGTDVHADANIDLSMAPRTARTLDRTDARVVQWLLERGIDTSFGTWTITESTLAAGQPATIREGRDGMILSAA